MNEAINGIENNVFEKIRREAAAKHRDIYGISTDIDDAINGLDRAYWGLMMLQESIEEEKKTPIFIEGRYEMFLSVFFLCCNRLYDEIKNLEKLNNELYDAYFEQKKQRGGVNNDNGHDKRAETARRTL